MPLKSFRLPPVVLTTTFLLLILVGLPACCLAAGGDSGAQGGSTDFLSHLIMKLPDLFYIPRDTLWITQSPPHPVIRPLLFQVTVSSQSKSSCLMV